MSATTTTAPDRPTWLERVGETAPIVDAPAFFGPPVSFVLGPWLLLVVLLIPPAAFLITLLLVAVVAAGLPVAIGALVASPYLLVRHLRARQAAERRRSASRRRPTLSAPAVSRRPIKITHANGTA
jgi:membrane protein implicated in regulation of membrane protease activity